MCLKNLFGGLCLVAFIVASAACLVGQTSHDTTKDHQSISNFSETAIGDWPKDPNQKATLLKIIWQRNCPPCRRIKVVAIRLIAEGYDIEMVYKDDDPRGAYKFPTLRYYLSNGGMSREEVGFKTAEHIKKYLRK